ncbi:MAG: hypothetical protein ACYCYI_10270 [Saccharofermentanales bacterium]
MEKLILQYEKDFFDFEFCKNKDNLENRLSKDFRNIDIFDFKIANLSDSIIMANYRAFENSNNSYALRTSIWIIENDRWKMLFHQGTLIKQI